MKIKCHKCNIIFKDNGIFYECPGCGQLYEYTSFGVLPVVKREIKIQPEKK